jgi:hypothetical protein
MVSSSMSAVWDKRGERETFLTRTGWSLFWGGEVTVVMRTCAVHQDPGPASGEGAHGSAPHLAEKLPKPERIGRSGTFLVVVEIDEDVAALLLPGIDAKSPFRQRP